ncbi:LCP family protein [Leptolyngbya sp. AN02str]|uniref:LCP family protein n=1 Tax=Leptolyngbya sp. AN02str TaxID=3423363 RepID=UPI003D31EF89
MNHPKVYSGYRPKLPKKKLTGAKRLWFMLGLVGIASSSAIAGALLAVSLASTPLLQSRLSPEDAEAFEGSDISSGVNFRLPQLTRPVNILVLGIKVLSSDVANPPEEVQDLGYHALVNSLDGLSDTMMLIRFQPSDRTLTVLSLPRDTRVRIDGVGTAKLNEANAYGGPASAAIATSNLLGEVPIDRYVRINIQGVEKLIDALGGIDVYVPRDMKYQDDSQHLYINLKQGQQRLNGKKAIDFLRFRYDEYGDIGRVQRQQLFMRAMAEQALNPATITRLPQILSVIQENVDTNLSVEELVALVGFGSQVDRSKVQMLMLPGDFSSSEEYVASYWLPNYRAIDQLVAQYFRNSAEATLADGEPIQASGYERISIQDSTGDELAADEVMTALADQGFTNVSVDQPWGEVLETTRIIAQQGNTATAESVRQALGVGEIRVESTGVLRSDITIRIGRDWLSQQSTTVSSDSSSSDSSF